MAQGNFSFSGNLRSSWLESIQNEANSNEELSRINLFESEMERTKKDLANDNTIFKSPIAHSIESAKKDLVSRCFKLNTPYRKSAENNRAKMNPAKVDIH